mgnify:CR=1 FL=1
MRAMNKRIVVLTIVAVILGGTALWATSAPSARPTYVFITIDTEPDFPPYMDSYRGIEEGIPVLLDLFEAYDVKATFLVTGNVAKHYPDMVRLMAEEHEIGCHAFSHRPLTSLSYEVKLQEIEVTTSMLESIVGRDVTSFRAPYHKCDEDVVSILEELGYLVESSAATGIEVPYHPSQEDWLSVGEMNILRIPVTRDPVLMYPYDLEGRSWPDVAKQILSREHAPGVIVIGMHPWEFVDLDLDPRYGAYSRLCGEETYNDLRDLLHYLSSQDITYLSLSEGYDVFA